MKITIECRGDLSVGIYGNKTTVDLGCELDEDDTKEYFREQFRKLFAELWDDGSTEVFFEGESRED